MLRRKTYLTPEQQWDRTAALVGAEFGPPGYFAVVRQCPGSPIYEEGLMQGGAFDGCPVPGPLFLVQARVNGRLFLAGDVFVGHYHANDVRSPVYGVSSKGRVLSYYWVGLLRLRKRKGEGGPRRHLGGRAAMGWVELPGRL